MKRGNAYLGINVTNWPAEKIELHQIDELIPYARNSRTHSDEQVAQIAASMKEWGWTNPVLIDENGQIIAGHGRILAARKLAYDQVPCMVAEGWSDAQKRAYVIADNKLALNAGWDKDLLEVEFSELDELGFDLNLIGFDAQELANLFDPIKQPELKEENYSEVFNIVVECASEEEQEKIFNKLDSEGYKCRVQSL